MCLRNNLSFLRRAKAFSPNHICLSIIFLWFLGACTTSLAESLNKTYEEILSELTNGSLSRQQLSTIESDFKKINNLEPVERAKIQVMLGKRLMASGQETSVGFLDNSKRILNEFQQEKSAIGPLDIIEVARSDFEAAKLIARRYEKEKQYNHFMYILDDYSSQLVTLSSQLEPQYQEQLLDIASESWVYVGVKLVFRRKNNDAYGFISKALEGMPKDRISFERIKFQLKCAKSMTSPQNVSMIVQEVNKLIDQHTDSPWLAEAFWGLSDLCVYNTLLRYGFLTKILEICEKNPEKYTKIDMIYYTLAHDAKVLRFNAKSIMYFREFLEKFPDHPWRQTAERHLATARQKDRAISLEDEVLLPNPENPEIKSSTHTPESYKKGSATTSTNQAKSAELEAEDEQVPVKSQESIGASSSRSATWRTVAIIALGIAVVIVVCHISRLRRVRKSE